MFSSSEEEDSGDTGFVEYEYTLFFAFFFMIEYHLYGKNVRFISYVCILYLIKIGITACIANAAFYNVMYKAVHLQHLILQILF